MMNFGILIVLSCLFLACAKGNNIPDGDAKLSTYKEAEENHDFDALGASEKSLQKAGLKFEGIVTESSLNYVWVEEVPGAVIENARTVIFQDRIEALENYIQNARRVLSKYSEPYNSDSPSRRREVHSLSKATRSELEKKLELCGQTLSQLQQLLEAN